MSRSVLPRKKVSTSSCCAPAGEAATLHRTSRASSVFFIAAERQLELIGQGGGRFFARHDRNDFEVDEVGPLGDPLLKERDVTAFHQLETTAEVCRNPLFTNSRPSGMSRPLWRNRWYTDLASWFRNCSMTMNSITSSRSLPHLHQAAARSSLGSSGSFTGCLRLAERSSALVSISRLCASAAVAAWVGRPSAIRLSHESVSSRIGPRNSPSAMSPGG